MEDSRIVELYFLRDEHAISETEAKYGAFCRKIALNILSSDADAEECVNDTYMRAWESIPPQRPEKLGAWLGRVVRNIAYDILKKNHRQKRFSETDDVFSELEDCIPSFQTVEREIEAQELTEILNRWLESLPQDDRILFMRRYWHGQSVASLANECGVSPSNIAKRMYNLRQKLKAMLEKEGYLP